MIEELRGVADGVAPVPAVPATDSQFEGSIMVVDDQPANLNLLEDLLSRQGHSIRSFPRGRLALDAAARHPPDLILLDINMPELNGFEVCRQLKADERLADIPVLFLSALNDEKDKVRAFLAGGVDYVTKPFQVEEVRARVETHLAIYRARKIERDLLEKTLNGAVKALSALVHLTSPAVAGRSEVLRSIVVHMTARMGLKDPWQYELAAMLSLIGCMALPADVFEVAYSGEKASATEMEMYRGHPDIGFKLLSGIPRLENVAEMVRRQHSATSKSGGNTAKDDPCSSGIDMLRTAQELDRRTLRGISFAAACDQLRLASSEYPAELLAALRDYSPSRFQFGVKRLSPQQLLPRMILEEDVVTLDRKVTVISKGATLTEILIERILNFAVTRGVLVPIQVRVPQG